MKEYTLQISAATSRGGKEINEDSIYLQGERYPRSGKDYGYTQTIHVKDACFAVADGISMGGGGKIASQTALSVLDTYRMRMLRHPAKESVMDALNAANKKTMRKVQQKGFSIGGTTLSLLHISDVGFLAANVGDSPIYLCRNRKLERISYSHTLATMKRERNVQYISEADEHTLYHYIGNPTSAGGEQAYFHEGTLEKGDVFLLCTDGITEIFTNEELSQCLSSPIHAHKMIEDKKHKVYDNLSLIAIQIITYI